MSARFDLPSFLLGLGIAALAECLTFGAELLAGVR